MSFLISKIIGFLTTPLVWIIMSLIITTILWILKSKAAHKWLIGTVALTLVMTNPLLANTIFHYWEKPTNAISNNHSDVTYDYAVVLSGMASWDPAHDQYNFGESADRLWEALRLHKNGKVKKILITGGNASIYYKQPPEAVILRNYLKEIGIADSLILIETRARNTHENALYTTQIIKNTEQSNSPLLLITSAYHMPRALACFAKSNLQCTPYPVDFYVPHIKTDFHSLVIPSVAALEKWNILLHEWIGFLYYKLMGYI